MSASLPTFLAFLSGGIITVVALLVCAVATESEDETEKGIVARRSRVGQASSGHTGLHYQPTFRAPMFQHRTARKHTSNYIPEDGTRAWDLSGNGLLE
jgi:hypothetical protein